MISSEVYFHKFIIKTCGMGSGFMCVFLSTNLYMLVYICLKGLIRKKM